MVTMHDQKPDAIMLPAHFHHEQWSKNLQLGTFKVLVDLAVS